MTKTFIELIDTRSLTSFFYINKGFIVVKLLLMHPFVQIKFMNVDVSKEKVP